MPGACTRTWRAGCSGRCLGRQVLPATWASSTATSSARTSSCDKDFNIKLSDPVLQALPAGPGSGRRAEQDLLRVGGVRGPEVLCRASLPAQGVRHLEPGRDPLHHGLRLHAVRGLDVRKVLRIQKEHRVDFRAPAPDECKDLIYRILAGCHPRLRPTRSSAIVHFKPPQAQGHALRLLQREGGEQMPG